MTMFPDGPRMTGHPGWFGVLLIVLAIGVGALLMLGGDTETPHPTHGAGRLHEHDTVVPPALAGRPGVEGTPPAPHDPPPVPPPTASPSDAPPRSEARTHVLLGRLEGFDAELPGTARVTVKGLTEEYEKPEAEPTCDAGEDGRFELDVTALFQSDLHVVELQVHVDHPLHLPAMARIALPRAPKKAAGRTIYEVTVPVQPAGVIHGRVEGPDGRSVGGAVVAVLRVVDDEPQVPPITKTETTDDGLFRLRVGETARYAVIAAHAGLRPASQIFTTGPGRTVDLKTLRLDRGVSIAGRVTLYGKGLAGAEIDAGLRAGDAAWLHLGGATVTWSKGEVFPGLPTILCDEGGRYEMSGLVAGTYWVRPDASGGVRIHQSVWEQAMREVEAPATGVDFALDLGRLVVQARAKEAALGRVIVQLQGIGDEMGGVLMGRTDENGRQETHVVPGGRYAVAVDADGYEPKSVEVTAPGPGEEELVILELEPRRPRPVLVVTLVGPRGESIPEAGFGFFEPEQTGSFAKEDVTVRSDDNTFRFEAWPGRWRMVVRAGGAWRYGRGLYAEAETIVDVPELGTAEVTVAVPAGGRIRIAVRAPDGTLLNARCAVNDDKGEKLPVVFCQRTQHGAVASGGRLMTGMPSEVDPALPPATYRVVLTHKDYVTRTLEVKVEAGRMVDVDVTLEPNS